MFEYKIIKKKILVIKKPAWCCDKTYTYPGIPAVHGQNGLFVEYKKSKDK